MHELFSHFSQNKQKLHFFKSFISSQFNSNELQQNTDCNIFTRILLYGYVI